MPFSAFSYTRVASSESWCGLTPRGQSVPDPSHAHVLIALASHCVTCHGLHIVWSLPLITTGNLFWRLLPVATFIQRYWEGLGTSCSGMLCSLHPSIFSRPAKIRHWAAWFELRADLDLCKSLARNPFQPELSYEPMKVEVRREERKSLNGNCRMILRMLRIKDI